MIIATTNLVFTATDLTPGKKVEPSFEFADAHGQGTNEGLSAEKVRADGHVTFTVDLSALTRGRAGSVHMWLRPKGSDFNADPILDESGNPVETTIFVP